MVEPILYASLGALLATLVGLAFLPLFWRRAVRLTTRDLLRRLPVSVTEIVAAQDRLRAEQAMAMRVVERKAERAIGDATRDRVDSARARSTELGHLASLSDLRAQVAALEAEGARVKGELDRTGGEAASAFEALKEAKAESEQAARDLQAARQDASASRHATEQARIEAAAREAEIKALRARLAGTGAEASAGAGGLTTLASPQKRMPRADIGLDDTMPGARGPAERIVSPYEDAALAALRERLDEVADAIVKASETPAAPKDQPRPAAPAPAPKTEAAALS